MIRRFLPVKVLKLILSLQKSQSSYCTNWQKVIKMSHFDIDYVSIIHNAGHRVTPQRLTILDTVCEGDGHTTMGEIYARARLVDQSIDRSTVYRTLKFFLELGLVVSADMGDGETYYEIAKPHHHLVLFGVCGECRSE